MKQINYIIVLLYVVLAFVGCNSKLQSDTKEPQKTKENDALPAIDEQITIKTENGLEQKKQIILNKPVVDYCMEGNCSCGDEVCDKGNYCVMDVCFKIFNKEATSTELEENNYVEISQKELDKLKIEFCANGNCPCGDGFCSKGSYCIIDTCFCGVDFDRGYIDNIAIASNKYGEFECVEYGGDGYDYGYDFICTHKQGCKTADGKKYKKSTVDYSSYKLDNRLYVDDVLGIGESDKENKDYYNNLVMERYLIDHCGKRLPKDLKILYQESSEETLEPQHPETRRECDRRVACNDKSVSPEHISEYVCAIGKKYSPGSECWNYDDAIGLRCNQNNGCVCGDTHCPKHALCKEGSCLYDLYYQHRVCPGKDWNPNLNDIDNYILSLKEDIKELCPYIDEDDWFECEYYECYWDLYKITPDNPCDKK